MIRKVFDNQSNASFIFFYFFYVGLRPTHDRRKGHDKGKTEMHHENNLEGPLQCMYPEKNKQLVKEHEKGPFFNVVKWMARLSLNLN